MVNEIVNVTENNKQLLSLFSRINSGDFSTITSDKLDLIISNLNEIDRATKSFGKKDSQTFSKLTSLTMVASSPYGRLKQCLAIIEKKRSALKENLFLIRKNLNRLKRLEIEKEKLNEEPNNNVYYNVDLEDINIQIDEIQCSSADAIIYIEGAIKEIASYQDAYKQIKSTNNIPNDWNESDYEEFEVQEHIRSAFKFAVRDIIMTGRINVGTQEYLEQFGIHPLHAVNDVQEHITKMRNNGNKDITTLYEFLDYVADKYHKEYRKCIKRIGIETLVTQEFLYNGE